MLFAAYSLTFRNLTQVSVCSTYIVFVPIFSLKVASTTLECTFGTIEGERFE